MLLSHKFDILSARSINCAHSESVFSEIYGGELDEPAGLAGESVDGSDNSSDLSGRKWSPPLCEKLETA